jgi:hypothetical protein
MVCSEFLLVGIIMLLGANFFRASAIFAASNDQLQIHFSNNQLSVLIDNCPLFMVLDKLQAIAGLESAVAEEAAQRQITARFHFLPLEAALKTILDGFNYSFIYGPDGRVKKVSVLRNVTGEATRESQPLPSSNSFGTNLSEEERKSESRQGDSRIVQKRTSETAGISSSSDAVMVVSPPSSGGMDIKSLSETMQIDPPQADDAMKINISPKHPE